MTSIIEIVSTAIATLLACYLVVQKYLVVRAKDNTAIASESAITSHFKMLHEALEHNRKEAEQSRRETTELRLKFLRMDKAISDQHQVIARMQMLLHQLGGMIEQSGIEVPSYMQAELDSLIAPLGDNPREPN